MDMHVFMDISLQLSMLLWISIWISLDFYGYPCIDLLMGSRSRTILIFDINNYCFLYTLFLGDEKPSGFGLF